MSVYKTQAGFPHEIIKKATYWMWESVERQWSEEEPKYLSQVLLKS